MPFTDEERSARFAAIVARTGKMYAHPDTIRDMAATYVGATKESDNGTIWSRNSVTLVPVNFLPVGKWYAIDVPSREELMKSLLTPAFD